MDNNPYLNNKKMEGFIPPLKVPICDFETNLEMEEELLQNELCVARTVNTGNKGFTHHVALVYKDDEGNVYSTTLYPHHGDLLDTPENRKWLKEQKEMNENQNEK